MSYKPTTVLPKDGLAGFAAHYKSDAIAGFMVFLIALPLSLGISKASGFPPIAGVFTAIIGGIVVSILGGAKLTIKGPAAGLIVIALGAIEELGRGNTFLGYKLTLGVIVVSGLVQIGFGLLKLGRLADFFPVTVIHGMLAAIGIIIAAKQIHVAVGVKPEGKGTLALLQEIPHSLANLNPEIASIGLLSLIILFGLPLVKNQTVRRIPGPLVVLLVAVPLGFVFDLDHVHHYVFNRHLFEINPNDFLVVLPKHIWEGITFPDFSAVYSLTGVKYVCMFALVGSIESLLSAQAIDALDPWKRKSDMNRDLKAVGVGNVLAGAIGGLPMIAEIVRSSANIHNNAHTRWSNFYHGLFLLLFVSFASTLIHHIPNAALAAMLLYTGYRLASPGEFFKTYSIGMDQLSIFLTTIFVTLATDLLLGITAGIVLKLILQLLLGVPFSNLFSSNVVLEENPSYSLFKIKDSATFSNFLGFKSHLAKVPADKPIVLDFSQAKLIDHSFMQHIHHLAEDKASKGMQLTVQGIEQHKPFSDHPLAARKVPRIGRGDTQMQPPLNQRQKSLASFAIKHQLGFHPYHVTSAAHLRRCTLLHTTHIKYRLNLITGYWSHGEVTMFDIAWKDVYQALQREQLRSMMIITISDSQLPSFCVVREGLFERLAHLTGRISDIDFPDLTEFSKQYQLTGDKPEAIKAVLESGLGELLMTNKAYSIESTGRDLLIVPQQDAPLSGEALHSLYLFGLSVTACLEVYFQEDAKGV
jgi:MFS superfamily sulfate permease-like transporter